MAANNKKRKTPPTGPSFHRDFCEPDDNTRVAALGAFPFQGHRSEALWETIADRESSLALNDLDVPCLFQPAGMPPISPPVDELDWLACVPEKGQGLDDYVCQLTSRSGRLRPLANARGQSIGLLPIVLSGDETWTGPCLELLSNLTRTFYCRPVEILEPAIVTPIQPSSSTANKKGKAAIEFYSKIQLEGNIRRSLGKYAIEGRQDAKTNRSQYQVSTILERLHTYRSNLNQDTNFCIMGVTMQDLYNGASNDLFCAGMAQPVHKVALFSFLRYHPHIRISPLNWWDYDYQKRPGNFSYFELDAEPVSLSTACPTSLIRAASIEFLRRSSKLLVHELGHLFALDHYIYHKCLMMGTGHLVEDFAAPLHLCGICLRKLQWRLGFSVTRRYQGLASCLRKLGLVTEANWIQRQLKYIQNSKENGEEGNDHNTPIAGTQFSPKTTTESLGRESPVAHVRLPRKRKVQLPKNPK